MWPSRPKPALKTSKLKRAGASSANFKTSGLSRTTNGSSGSYTQFSVLMWGKGSNAPNSKSNTECFDRSAFTAVAPWPTEVFLASALALAAVFFSMANCSLTFE